MYCEFCNDIRPLSEVVEYPYSERWGTSTLARLSDGSIGFYVECDDYYYSDIYLWDIHYCPRCGRKLEEEIHETH